MAKKKKSCAIQKDRRFSTLRTKVLDVLVQARDIIRAESRWVVGSWGEDALGNSVNNEEFGKQYKDVCRVCAEGAVACSSKNFDVYRAAVRELDTTVLGDPDVPADSIVDVNDSLGRKRTVAFFTETIQRLRKQQKRLSK
jgi:hypothetical protein